MKIEWTGRGMTIPEATRSRIQRQIDKLERYLRGHAEAHVVLATEGGGRGNARYSAEVVVSNRLGRFAAKSESHDLNEAAIVAAGRIERQVRRAHDKVIDSRRRGGQERVGEPAGSVFGEAAPSGDEAAS